MRERLLNAAAYRIIDADDSHGDAILALMPRLADYDVPASRNPTHLWEHDAAMLRREGIDCESKYFNLMFWDLLGDETYSQLSKNRDGLGPQGPPSHAGTGPGQQGNMPGAQTTQRALASWAVSGPIPRELESSQPPRIRMPVINTDETSFPNFMMSPQLG